EPGEFDGTHLRKERSPLYKLDYLILTIPDPIDSRFDYLFDRVMDATQRAMAAESFVLDRYLLPWFQKVETGTGEFEHLVHGSKNAASLLNGLEDLPERPRPEEPIHWLQPGVLLFRKSPTNNLPPELRLVLLVGETPTSGVHKKAFFSA